MSNYKVSILIPVYNSEKFLRASIESALSQTYSDIEIIAINDGSTDSSLDVLQEYGDQIIIINQKNLGLAKAVNLGTKKISGNWIKWLSPDDILKSDAVEILVKKAKTLHENTIVYSNWEIINETGKKLRDFTESNYNFLEPFEFNVRLLDGQQININTCLIPYLLFEKGCFLNSLDETTAIDYDFFLRSAILYDTSFYLVEKSLLKYRVHKSQISHKKIIQSLKFIHKIKEDILYTLDERTRTKYEIALKQYSKNKTIRTKSMEFGLMAITKLFPESVTDQMLVFYLNQIRSKR